MGPEARRVHRHKASIVRSYKHGWLKAYILCLIFFSKSDEVFCEFLKFLLAISVQDDILLCVIEKFHGFDEVFVFVRPLIAHYILLECFIRTHVCIHVQNID